MALSELEQQVDDQLRRWRRDPRIMVRELFGVTPDPWQDDVLIAFATDQRISMQACKGPGKTCVLAWCAWNFLICYYECNIAVTSVSGDNLRDGLMKEMAVWQNRAPMLQEYFEWTVQRIFYKGKSSTHFLSARTWPKSANSEQQAQTLAGLHADYIMFILDESGSIPDSVMAAAEAALSSCKVGRLLQAGNPTMLEGPLYRAATSERHLWTRFEITGDPDDPKRATRVKAKWALEQIEKYGRDHPFVLVNVFGRFPPSSLTALIGPDEVRAAMKRYYRPYEIGNVPKILGIDVARQGAAESVIARRQGIQMAPFLSYRNVLNGVVGASIANRAWNEYEADACFVDATGGYGFTWLDQMTVLGRAGVPVQFSSKASDDKRYFNKRAEIYFLFVQWIQKGGALPPEDSDGMDKLLKALTQTQVTFNKDRLQLEEKEDIADRLGFSPDHADAGALTFAEPVTARSNRAGVQTRQVSAVGAGYDPFAEVNRQTTQVQGSAFQEYDPFATMR